MAVNNLKGIDLEYTEEQIRNEILVELANSTNGSMTTTELIQTLETRLNPTGKDAELADNRSDTYFSQKVRNPVSHRLQGTGLEYLGLANYDPNYEGWTITAAGRNYVAKLP